MNRRRFSGAFLATPFAISASVLTAEAQNPIATPLPTLLDIATGPVIGESGAVVTMHIYFDFQSTYCRDFRFDVLPLIARDFVINGQARIAFHDFPRLGTDPSIADSGDPSVDLSDPKNESSLAAQAAMSAGEQGRYLEMSQKLFSRTEGVQQGIFYSSSLTRIAELMGLDLDQFQASMESGKHIPTLAKSVKTGQENGIVAVPMFILDNGNGEQNVIQHTSEGYGLLKKQIELSVDTAP